MTTATEQQGERRVCLVTGASGTLGTAFCRRHATDYDIVAVGHTTMPRLVSQHATLLDPLDPAGHLDENDHPVFALTADLTRVSDIDRVVEVALARYGRVDMVVNAVGYSRWTSSLDRRLLPENLARHFEVNVTVPTAVTAAVARACWADAGADNARLRRNVVNVSSSAGIFVYPQLGQSAYGATKAALNFMTMHLAEELRPLGVRVNALGPTTFPGRVTTHQVVEGIRTLDTSLKTGEIMVITEEGTYFA